MPAKKIDYSTTVIYKIVCNDLAITDLYIGSTTNFRMRKHSHKCSCINENTIHYNTKIYQIIRDNGGWLNWSMLQIEEFPCANGNEARIRERYWCEQLNATLNCRFPIRDKTEYVEANKDKIREQRKEYRDLNKDKLNESKMRPYNCECGIICKFGNRLGHFKSKKHQAFIAQKDNIET